MTDESDRYEEFVRNNIAKIQQRHREELQPWWNRLVEIESMKPLPPMYLNKDEWDIVVSEDGHLLSIRKKVKGE